MIENWLNTEKFKDFENLTQTYFKKAKRKIKIKCIYPLTKNFLISLNTAQKTIGHQYKTDWGKISLPEICELYPQRIKNLFLSLNLDKEGLQTVKIATSKGNWLEACEALLEYYCHYNPKAWQHQIAVQPNTIHYSDAELLLKDTFTFQLVTGKVPRLSDYYLDWSYKGPKNDEQWAFFINRHYHLKDLFIAYKKTNNLDYICCLNNQIIDWILSSLSSTSTSTWAQWRGLEVAWRMINWSSIFYSLQPIEAFSPAARILMLSSVSDHANYLRHFHGWGANWLCREMNGLATLALYWPEFKQSQEWFKYAEYHLVSQINIQVYPDGVHKELTSHYHRVTMDDFQSFANLLLQSGQPVPPLFKKRLEQMWNYLAYSMRPDGYGVLNNDSDRDYNQAIIKEAAITYERLDWTSITTNRKCGQKPMVRPSIIFPWAGQMVMRSAWDKQAHWAFFDMGPMGINYHIHNDKLHLSVAAYGRDLLVDSGRYSYVRSPYWHYFRGSASHNVILVNGGGQKMDIRETYRPFTENISYSISDELDYARSCFKAGFIGVSGIVTHTRAVVYLRDQYWVVVDQILTNRPRQIETLWHFHPDCTVVTEADTVGSVDEGLGNLKIIPVSTLDWTVNLVQGQENPVQGWWSREYNHKQPNPTAIYSTQIQTSTCFAWVLVPAKDRVLGVDVHVFSATSDTMILSVKIGDHSPAKIAVNLNKNKPLKLSSDLILFGECAVLRQGKVPLLAGNLVDQSETQSQIISP